MKNKILLSLLFIFLLCTGFRETEFMERTEYYKPDGTVHVCLEDESGNISPIFTLDDYIEGCYLDLLAPDLREGFESVSELLLEPSDCIDSMYHGIRFELTSKGMQAFRLFAQENGLMSADYAIVIVAAEKAYRTPEALLIEAVETSRYYHSVQWMIERKARTFQVALNPQPVNEIFDTYTVLGSSPYRGAITDVCKNLGIFYEYPVYDRFVNSEIKPKVPLLNSRDIQKERKNGKTYIKQNGVYVQNSIIEYDHFNFYKTDRFGVLSKRLVNQYPGYTKNRSLIKSDGIPKGRQYMAIVQSILEDRYSYECIDEDTDFEPGGNTYYARIALNKHKTDDYMSFIIRNDVSYNDGYEFSISIDKETYTNNRDFLVELMSPVANPEVFEHALDLAIQKNNEVRSKYLFSEGKETVLFDGLYDMLEIQIAFYGRILIENKSNR